MRLWTLAKYLCNRRIKVMYKPGELSESKKYVGKEMRSDAFLAVCKAVWWSTVVYPTLLVNKKVMGEQERFPVKICFVQSCDFVQHWLLYLSNRHFYTGKHARSQPSSADIRNSFCLLSLGNKLIFPFISITSTLQVQGHLAGTSLIKCKILALNLVLEKGWCTLYLDYFPAAII